MTDKEQKTTPGPWYAIEYAGYWAIQSENFYGIESSVLDEDNNNRAEENAKLAARAPELLKENDSLQARILELEKHIDERLDSMDRFDNAEKQWYEKHLKDQLAIDELKETLLDCFDQSCSESNGKYDHWCLSAYENTQDVLLKYGVIKPEQCNRK